MVERGRWEESQSFFVEQLWIFFFFLTLLMVLRSVGGIDSITSFWCFCTRFLLFLLLLCLPHVLQASDMLVIKTAFSVLRIFTHTVLQLGKPSSKSSDVHLPLIQVSDHMSITSQEDLTQPPSYQHRSLHHDSQPRYPDLSSSQSISIVEIVFCVYVCVSPYQNVSSWKQGLCIGNLNNP